MLFVLLFCAGLEDIVDVEDPLPPLQPMMQQDDNKSETMTGQVCTRPPFFAYSLG